MTLTVGGLFAGIGGFELGLERAGMEVRWHSDVLPFAQHILKKNWPDVPVYGDIKEMKGGQLEPVDVLCGGFPCQDLSVAGKGAGITGARSSLWKEYARLVDELRPRYVIVENVAVLRRRGLDVVLGDLSTLGYDAEWDCIRASDFGASHRRDRLWLVAYPNADSQPRDQRRSGLAEQSSARGNAGRACQCGHVPDARCPSRAAAHTLPGGLQPQVAESPCCGAVPDAECQPLRDEQGRCCRTDRDGRAVPGHDGQSSAVADADPLRRSGWPRVFGPAGWAESAYRRAGLAEAWAAEPDVGRVADGVPARVDRLTGLGNALVPQIAQWIGERIVAYEASVRP